MDFFNTVHRAVRVLVWIMTASYQDVKEIVRKLVLGVQSDSQIVRRVEGSGEQRELSWRLVVHWDADGT